MVEVTVKLTATLLAKLDRLRKGRSDGLTTPGRSTYMRHLLDKEPE